MSRSSFIRPSAVLAVLVLILSPAEAGSPFRFPEGKHGQGELRTVNGMPVLVVEGTPVQIGAAVGALAVRHSPQMSSYPEDLLRHYHVHGLKKAFLRAGRKMVERFPADYREELEAIAKGAHIDCDLVILGNTLFDLKKILACSAILVEPGQSAVEGPLLGRNLDYPSLGYAHEYSLVTVYRPAGAAHAFATVGFPGLVGCLSGINDAGLALAILEVFQVQAGKKKFDAAGLPYALCYRRILEKCSTIDEALALLKTMKRTTITNLVLADRTGVAVFEVTPRQVRVRHPEKGTCICTNHFCTEKLKPRVPLNYFRTFDRYAAMEGALPAGEKLGLPDIRHGLHAAAVEGKTLQTMIFEPAGLRLHLAIGTCPSSAGEMKVLELGPLFER